MTINFAATTLTPTGASATTRVIGDLLKRDRSANVKDFGAKGDAQNVTATITISVGTPNLSSTSALWALTDVGKSIVVGGAGSAGAALFTTILSFTDSQHITLANNAVTGLSGSSQVVTWGTDDWASITAAYNWNTVSLRVTQNNQMASFTGQAAFATFTGTCASNTLTINSGLVGTVVVGQTLRTSAGNRIIASGSGTSWIFSGATLAVGPESMSTNAVLVATGVVGTISVNDFILDASTSGLAYCLSALAQQTGSTGLDGTYVVLGASSYGVSSYTYNPSSGVTQLFISPTEPAQFWDGQSIVVSGLNIAGLNGTFTVTSLPPNTNSVTYTGPTSLAGTPSGGGTLTVNPMNFGPVPMISVGGTLTFASVPATVQTGMHALDATNPKALDRVFLPAIGTVTSTTISIAGYLRRLINVNDIITVNTGRGIIDFPFGTYFVSQPIDFSDPLLISCIFRGHSSSIVGNFSDYIFRRYVPDTSGQGMTLGVEGFLITNNHPVGGGIRLGYSVRAYIRDCVIVANLGINTASDDVISGTTSQEVHISNCYLNPGLNASGSTGILTVSDGPIANCHVVGYDRGLITWGQQGGASIFGGTFELCKSAVSVGQNPAGQAGGGGGGATIAGTRFKNNGTAIDGHNGGLSAIIEGVVIEAATGTIAGDPQYGIRLDFGAGSIFKGITVTGVYAQHAIELGDGVNTQPLDNWFIGVRALNGGVADWQLPTNHGATVAHFIGCNVAPVFTMVNLPAFPSPISAITWSGGITTVTGGGSFFVGQSSLPITATIEGVTGGTGGTAFNGFFNVTAIPQFNQVSYSQSNPGASSGTVNSSSIIVLNEQMSANESDCYNVSDSLSSTQWADPGVGGGSVRALVRWNGTRWSVIGV